jgi:transcriptional regulator with XRE-family HTH domain
MTDTLSRQVAANIKAEYTRRRLSQGELAARLGISESALSRKLQPGRLLVDDLDKISQALSVPLVDLLVSPIDRTQT